MGFFKEGPAGHTVELRVTGMTCGHCEMRVSKALSSVPGVKDARADHNEDRAVVTVEGNVSMDDLVAAVDSAGYSAEPAE